MSTTMNNVGRPTRLVAGSGAASADLPQIEPAAPPPLEVPIALLVDLSSGQTLYAREPDRRFMPASITKEAERGCVPTPV